MKLVLIGEVITVLDLPPVRRRLFPPQQAFIHPGDQLRQGEG